MEDGYSESLASLVKATNEDLAKYHVDEAPHAVASTAQRVNIKEKIDLSILAYVIFDICVFRLLLMHSILVPGSKVRPQQRGHSAPDGDHRILDNTPKERGLS